MSKILGIDPGSKQSAYVIYDSETMDLLRFDILDNETMLGLISVLGRSKLFSDITVDELAIEYPRPRGQMMTWQLVDTICWIGRFVQAAGGKWTKIDRKDVKMKLCGTLMYITENEDGTKKRKGVTDANVRSAIISRYEEKFQTDNAIGKKKTPGVLYGVSKDVRMSTYNR